MGTFSDDEERNRRDNPRYAGKVTQCAACKRKFVPGDMLYVVNTKAGQVAVCYYDAEGYEATVLGKPNCLDAWRKHSGSNAGAVPMVFSGE